MNNVTYTEIVTTLRTALVEANDAYVNTPSAKHFDAQMRAALAFQAITYSDKSKLAQVLATARSVKPGGLTVDFLQEVAFSIVNTTPASLAEVIDAANKGMMATV